MDLSLRKLRKNIAAFSVLALVASFLVIGTASAAVATDVYADVDGTEWYAGDVQWGLDSGILDETQANFRAGDNATRAEFFKMTAAGAGIPEAACDETLFPDLNADHWGCGWVTAMAEAGVVSGDGPTSATPDHVRPNDNILRAEAAKVVVEAYGLTGTTAGTVFTDVDGSEWYSDYAGIAYENCVFRGVGTTMNLEPARNIVRAEAIAVVNRGANPTTDCQTVVPAAGDLTVALAASTPGEQNTPYNVANHTFSAFELTASADEDVLVTRVVLSREGLGNSSDFSAVRLYVDGVQVGGDTTVNSSDEAIFNIAGTPIEVPAGETIVVEVRADMDTSAGSINQFCLVELTAEGASSGGDVAVSGTGVCGSEMTTTNASVGTVTVTPSQSSFSDVELGTSSTDVTFLDVKLENNSTGNDANLTRLTLKQNGSADPEDFANMRLMDGSTLVADNTSWVGDYLSFDLMADPYLLPDGSPKNLTLKGDIVGGQGSDFSFIIRDAQDVTAKDTNGFNTQIDLVSFTPTKRDIIGGNIAFSTAGPSTGEVASSSEDHVFMYFNMSTLGTGVSVSKLTLEVGCGGLATDLANIDDVKIWMDMNNDPEDRDWQVVDGPIDFDGACGSSEEFKQTFSVAGGVTQALKITADIASSALDGEIYDINILDVTDDANILMDYENGDPVTAATDVSGGTLDGAPMTVAQPNVSVSIGGVPGDTTQVRNADGIEIATFNFVASSASDTNLNTVTLTCTETVGATGCANAFNNLKLINLSSGLQVGSTKNLSLSGTIDGTVEFSPSLDISAGSSVTLLLKADVTGSVVNADAYTFKVTAAQARQVPTNDIIDVNGLPTAVRTITMSDGGVLTNAASFVPGKLVVAGEEEDVLAVKFAANNLESWEIQKLGLVDAPGVYEANALETTTDWSLFDVDAVAPAPTLTTATAKGITADSGANAVGMDSAAEAFAVGDYMVFDNKANMIDVTGMIDTIYVDAYWEDGANPAGLTVDFCHNNVTDISLGVCAPVALADGVWTDTDGAGIALMDADGDLAIDDFGRYYGFVVTGASADLDEYVLFDQLFIGLAATMTTNEPTGAVTNMVAYYDTESGPTSHAFTMVDGIANVNFPGGSYPYVAENSTATINFAAVGNSVAASGGVPSGTTYAMSFVPDFNYKAVGTQSFKVDSSATMVSGQTNIAADRGLVFDTPSRPNGEPLSAGLYEFAIESLGGPVDIKYLSFDLSETVGMINTDFDLYRYNDVTADYDLKVGNNGVDIQYVYGGGILTLEFDNGVDGALTVDGSEMFMLKTSNTGAAGATAVTKLRKESTVLDGAPNNNVTGPGTLGIGVGDIIWSDYSDNVTPHSTVYGASNDWYDGSLLTSLDNITGQSTAN